MAWKQERRKLVGAGLDVPKDGGLAGGGEFATPPADSDLARSDAALSGPAGSVPALADTALSSPAGSVAAPADTLTTAAPAMPDARRRRGLLRRATPAEPGEESDSGSHSPLRRDLTPRDVVLTALASLGLCAGIVLVADSLHTPKPPPQPGPAQAFAAVQPVSAAAGRNPLPAADRPPRPTEPAAPILAPSTPTRVRIAAIKVDAPLMGLSLDKSGHLAPPPEQKKDVAGWYQDGTTPGALGTAVIAGHVDNRHGPAVFYNLGALKKGETIQVDRADGLTAVFAIDAIEAYDARDFPTAKVYGAATRAELRVITCGAGFDEHRGRYRGNVVVYAHLTAAQRGTT